MIRLRLAFAQQPVWAFGDREIDQYRHDSHCQPTWQCQQPKAVRVVSGQESNERLHGEGGCQAIS
jgi:hypothetical protein